MITIAICPRFPLGRVVITAKANAHTKISPEDYLRALRRHNQGDWVEFDPHDRAFAPLDQ